MKKTIILICTIIFLGCAQGYSNLDRQTLTGIDEGDKIAVLIDSTPYSQPSPNEKKICNCLSNGFKKLNKEVDIISSEEFRNAAILNINLPKNSTTQTAIDYLFADKNNAKQIEHMGVRYIVLVDETVTTEYVIRNESGWDMSGQAPAYIFIDKATQVNIEIFGLIYDVKRGSKSGEIRSWSSGESYFLLMTIMAFGWPSGASFSHACEQFGKDAARFITGQEPTE